jgi:N-acyl-D-amino-acid deacylase
MYSIIIKNARLIDGTGHPERRADIAVEDDKIVAVAEKISSNAQTTIEAEGKIVTPGFIDIQNHSDSYWQLFDNPNLDSLISQGYTTILVGNCGASLAPLLSQEALLALQKWHSLEGTNINWQSFAEFAETMLPRRFGCNITSLVGYSTLRRGLMGDKTIALTNEELKALKAALERALSEGAFGLSSGLAYAHEIGNSEVELYELAQVIRKTETLMSLHLRNESEKVVESVHEAISLAQQAEINLKISHLKIRNPGNWHFLEEMINELEVAWHRGARIHFDAYPYTSVWQVLYSYLPPWVIQGGRHHVQQQLRNPVQRNKILTHLNNSGVDLKNLIIASTASKLQINGKTLGRLAADMGVSSEEAVLKLIENGGSEVLVFDQCLEPSGVEELINHPLGLIATDGGGFPLSLPDRLVHPRCFGTAARFLHAVISQKKVSLPEAVRKMTSEPAAVMGLKKRGVIMADNYADLVIWNEADIKDNATLTNPFQFSSGVEYVWVNGQLAAHKNQPVGVSAGRFLLRGQK